MSNFFNIDNGFFSFLSKVCDVLFLSVIYLVFCIPIITIGPANTALYYTVVKVIRRERGYLFREFFKSFRVNFKRGAIIGVILTVMFIILAFDLISAWLNANNNTTTSSIFLGIYLAITFILLCFSIYAFPILSRFDMTIRQVARAAAFMSMRHLPFTIVMAAILVASIAGVLYMPILMFIIPATSVFLISFLMERILKKYMPKKEEEVEAEDAEEGSSKDEWYLE